MDSGAKGRAERCFLYAHTAHLFPLRARALDRPLFDGAIHVCPRFDVQADAGHPAIRAASSGLLAAR